MSGQYQIIYADPPWQFNRKKGRGVAENHYPTMNLESIKALPVDKLAAPNCALFLWATAPMLPEALAVINAWGFEFKTVAFVWIKIYPKSNTAVCGLGNWTRPSTEICLLATRGHPRRQGRSVYQIIISHREEHSKKPDETRSRIEALMGDVPRIELFARRSIPNWSTWGNEVICTDPQLSQMGM